MSCICPGNDEAPPGNEAFNCISSFCASGAPGIRSLSEIHPSSHTGHCCSPLRSLLACGPCVLLQRPAFPGCRAVSDALHKGRGITTSAHCPSLLVLGLLDPFPCSCAAFDILPLTAIAQVFSVNGFKKLVSGNSKKRGYIREAKLISAPLSSGEDSSSELCRRDVRDSLLVFFP